MRLWPRMESRQKIIAPAGQGFHFLRVRTNARELERRVLLEGGTDRRYSELAHYLLIGHILRQTKARMPEPSLGDSQGRMQSNGIRSLSNVVRERSSFVRCPLVTRAALSRQA